MRKIKITTDSASDISIEAEQKLNIGMLNFMVTMNDTNYISRVDFDNKKFYEMLANYDGLPTHSQITPFQFQEYYQSIVEEGYDDLILVLINKEGSATYSNAEYAKILFFEENPDLVGKFEIYLVDSRGYTGMYGEPVEEAAQMIIDGKDAKSIYEYLVEKINKRMIYFGMYTLKYAGKSGRIPSAAAFVGDVLGIKPIMKIWDHKIDTAKKVRGPRFMQSIVDLSCNDMEPGSSYSLVYGDNEENLSEMVIAMTKKLGYGPKKCYQIGAAISINAGPKVIGVIFDAKEEARHY